MAKKRSTYHHGDLRSALIMATDEIVLKKGIEGFSLRLVSKKAGVSPSATAHHFETVKGLLTEVVLLALKKRNEFIELVEHSDNPAKEVRALALALVNFAVEYPGYFRLMLRHDLINQEDSRHKELIALSNERLGTALARYKKKPNVDMSKYEDAADCLSITCTLHGLSHYILEGKTNLYFPNESEESFVKIILPKMIDQMFP